jgi:biopolymer transport protein ExbD
MRLTSRKAGKARVELAMTSMIDVVFLLLIFFMVTTAWVRAERQLDPALRVENRSAAAASDLQPAMVEVVRSGGVAVYRLGLREVTTAAELETLLQQFENKSDGAFVRVADDVPFGMAAAAIQACKSASFVPVSYVPLDTVNP